MDDKIYHYNAFCKSKACPHYIEWPYGISCKKIGESHVVYKYPDDCPFLDEIKLIEIAPEPTNR